MCRKNLQAQHDKLAKVYHKAHPTHVYEKGEWVWYNGHQKETNSKLQRFGQAPLRSWPGRAGINIQWPRREGRWFWIP